MSELSKRWTKRPVTIDALLWNGENVAAVEAFVDEESLMWAVGKNEPILRTLEGNMTVGLGDYIIKGVKGEFYPCKPDIFAATYEPDRAGERRGEIGLPLLGKSRTFWTSDATPEELELCRSGDHPSLLYRLLGEREEQLLQALRDLAAAREELKHWEERPFYTANLFANDGEMVGKDFSQVTEDDFRGLFEYSDECKCQPCAEIRYLLKLRADLAAANARIAKLEILIADNVGLEAEGAEMNPRIAFAFVLGFLFGIMLAGIVIAGR